MAISIRYQTKAEEGNVMSFPKMPVNPQTRIVA